MGVRYSLIDIQPIIDTLIYHHGNITYHRLPSAASSRETQRGTTYIRCRVAGTDDVVIKLIRKDSAKPSLGSVRAKRDRSENKAVSLLEYLDDLLAIQQARADGNNNDEKYDMEDETDHIRNFYARTQPSTTTPTDDTTAIATETVNSSSTAVLLSPSRLRASSRRRTSSIASPPPARMPFTRRAHGHTVASSSSMTAAAAKVDSKTTVTAANSDHSDDTHDADHGVDVTDFLTNFLPRFVERLYESNAKMDIDLAVPVNYTPAHANLPEIRQVLDNDAFVGIVTNYYHHTLDSALRFNPDWIAREEMKLFVVYQLLHTLRFCHRRGVIHGNLSPSACLVSPNMWLTLTGFECPSHPSPLPPLSRMIAPSPTEPESVLIRWVDGKMSNFDYIMELNRLAGRISGDAERMHHPVMPWVVDFTSPNGGWRDFKKTKFRLQKGDEQLDFTFNSSSTPHHVTETLSEITYYVYMARRTPVDILKRVVRSHFVPNEYPPSMARIFKWTPDECIPEFYTDTTMFTSMHRELGLGDMELPSWCPTPDEFIRYHREQLEGEHVSRNLHHWIDLTFGYKLSGRAAIAAKNVRLPSREGSSGKRGIVQLFDQPHPSRRWCDGKELFPQADPLPGASTDHGHETKDPHDHHHDEEKQQARPVPVMPSSSADAPSTSSPAHHNSNTHGMLLPSTPAATTPSVSSPHTPATTSSAASSNMGSSSAAAAHMGMLSSSPSPSPRHIPGTYQQQPSSPHPATLGTPAAASSMTPFSPTPVGAAVVGSGIEGVPTIPPTMIHQHSAPVPASSSAAATVHLPHHAPPVIHSSSTSSAASSSSGGAPVAPPVNASSIVLPSGSLPCVDPLSSYEVSKLFEARCQSFHEGAYVPYAYRSVDITENDLEGPTMMKDPSMIDTITSGSSNINDTNGMMNDASLSGIDVSQRQRHELEGMDMFALGCLISELFTKRPLFSPRTLPLYQDGRYIPDITTLPQPVRALVSKLISVNPKDRPTAAVVMSTSAQLNFHHYKILYRFLSQLEKKKATFPLNRTNTATATPSATASNIASSSSTAAASTSVLRGAASLTVTTSLSNLQSSATATNNGSTPIPLSSSPSPSPLSFSLMAPVPLSGSASLSASPNGHDSSINNGASILLGASSQRDTLEAPSPASTSHGGGIIVNMTDMLSPTPPPPPMMVDTPAAAAPSTPQRQSSHHPHDASTNSATDNSRDTTIPLTPPVSAPTVSVSPSIPMTPNGSASRATNNGPDPVCVWLLNRLPSLLSLPNAVFILVVPHCIEIMLQPERTIHCLGLFELLGAKLGKTASEEHLRGALRTLMNHRTHDIALQCALLRPAFWRCVRARFHYMASLQDYLEYFRNALVSNNPVISTIANDTIVEFAADLKRTNDEELMTSGILLPLISRLGRAGCQPVVTTLIRIAKECSPSFIVNVFLPNAMDLIERGSYIKTGDLTTAPRGRESELFLLNGLNMLYEILPDLTPESLQYLLDLQTFRTLLCAPIRGPLTVSCVRKLLQIIVFLVVELGPHQGTPAKAKQKLTGAAPNTQSTMPILASACDFLGLLVSKLDGGEQPQGHTRVDVEAKCPYDAATCREFICMLYVPLSKTLPATTVRRAMPTHERIDVIIRDCARRTAVDREIDRARRHSETGHGSQWYTRVPNIIWCAGEMITVPGSDAKGVGWSPDDLALAAEGTIGTSSTATSASSGTPTEGSGAPHDQFTDDDDGSSATETDTPGELPTAVAARRKLAIEKKRERERLRKQMRDTLPALGTSSFASSSQSMARTGSSPSAAANAAPIGASNNAMIYESLSDTLPMAGGGRPSSGSFSGNNTIAMSMADPSILNDGPLDPRDRRATVIPSSRTVAMRREYDLDDDDEVKDVPSAPPTASVSPPPPAAAPPPVKPPPIPVQPVVETKVEKEKEKRSFFGAAFSALTGGGSSSKEKEEKLRQEREREAAAASAAAAAAATRAKAELAAKNAAAAAAAAAATNTNATSTTSAETSLAAQLSGLTGTSSSSSSLTGASTSDTSAMVGTESYPLSLTDLVTSPQPTAKSSWKFHAEVKHTARVHSGSILAMDTHPTQGIFVTGSRDCMVKLWSIGLSTSTLHNPIIYRGHKQPVFDVRLLTDDRDEVPLHVASCDYNIHVWDAETGRTITPHHNQFTAKQDLASAFTSTFSSSKPNAEAAVCFQYLSARHSLAVGTTQATLRFLDLRSGRLSSPWRHTGSLQAVAAVRSIAVSASSNWIASGLTTGEITLFDERTGVILSQWKAHEGQVLKLTPYGDRFLVSCGADRCICLWDVRGPEPLLQQRFTGLAESVRSLTLHRTDFVCAIGHKIGVGSLKKSTDKGGPKVNLLSLKGQKNKSTIVSLAMLHSYRYLIMGTEDGKVLLSS